jgi:signal transduction histidine kinase
MKNNVRYCFFIFLLFSQIVLNADVIQIKQDTKDIDLLEKSSIYLDKNSEKSIDDIVQLDKKFHSCKRDFLNFGYIFKDTVWLKIVLKNSSNKLLTRYIVLDEPNIDIVNLYSLQNGTLLKQTAGTWQRKEFSNELNSNFKITLPPNEKRIFYIELKPLTHSLHFHLHLQEYKFYTMQEIKHQLFLTIFFSILLVVFIYTVSIAINSDNNIYYYYAFFISAVFLHHFSLTGMIHYFLPTNREWLILQSYMPPYYLALVIFAIFLFANKFLHLYKYPRLYRPLQFLIFLVILLLIFNSSQNYLLSYLTPLAIVFALYLESVSIYLYIKKQELYAKYFVMIWGISLSGMIVTMLYYVGVLSQPIAYLFEITILLEVFAFSIILARQIKSLQEDMQKKSVYLQRQSKMAAMGEMIQNIAHQWRQPLSEINAVMMKIDTDFYTNKLTKKSLQHDTQRVEMLTEHMSETLESFSNYFQRDEREEIEDLVEVIYQAVRLLETELLDIDVKVNIKEFGLKMKIDKGYLIQVLNIILMNAVDVLNMRNISQKEITITLKCSNKRNIIEIEDNAGGIKDEYLSKIFQANFTTKKEKGGLGIGLYMAKMLIEDSMQGELYVQNQENGARFIILL